MGENAPTATIELDKTRHMQFTFGVAKRFKEATGKSIEVFDEGEADIDDIGTLMYFMLKKEDKDLKQEDVDEMLHLANLPQYIEILAEILPESMPEVEGGEDPKAPENSTGSSSGVTPESISE